jgi:hypothetical protein
MNKNFRLKESNNGDSLHLCGTDHFDAKTIGLTINGFSKHNLPTKVRRTGSPVDTAAGS